MTPNSQETKLLQDILTQVEKSSIALGNIQKAGGSLKTGQATRSLEEFKRSTDQAKIGVSLIIDASRRASSSLTGFSAVVTTAKAKVNDFKIAADNAGSQITRLATAAKSSKEELQKLSGETGKTLNQFGLVSNSVSSLNTSLTGHIQAFNTSFGDLKTATDSISQTISNSTATLSSALSNINVDPTNINTAFESVTDSIEKGNGLLYQLRSMSNWVFRAASAAETFSAKLSATLSTPISISDFNDSVEKVGKLLTGIRGGNNGGLAGRINRVNVALRLLIESLRNHQRDLRDGSTGVGTSADPDPSRPKTLAVDENLANRREALRFISSSISSIFSSAKTGILHSLDEMFGTLASRGYGVVGMLTDFSSASIRSGMSIREFARLLDKQQGVLSRVGFEQFDKQLTESRDNLKQYGIFGPEANELSASMASASQSLGVPVKDLGSGMNAQTTIFEELRKTVGVTAEQFQDLVQIVAESEIVQRELIGLAPEDRKTRQEQILKTISWGKSLGLTEQASQRLTQALLEQRRSTVKDRFESAGRMTQAMSLVGMSADKIETARKLSMKRVRTADEDKIITQIMGEYASKAESIKNSGNQGMANAIESMEDKFTPQMKALYDASIGVKAATDSGDQTSRDTNHTLGALNKTLGELMTVLDGLGKNPFISALTSIIGTTINLMLAVKFGRTVGETIAARLEGVLLRYTQPSASAPPIPPGGPGQNPPGGRQTLRSRIGGGLAGIGAGLRGASGTTAAIGIGVLGASMLLAPSGAEAAEVPQEQAEVSSKQDKQNTSSNVNDLSKAVEQQQQSEESLSKKIGGITEKTGQYLAMASMFTGQFAPVVFGVGTAISVLGMGISKFGDKFTSSSKKNTSAIEKNTKVIQNSFRSTGPDNTLTTNDLGVSLLKNVLDSANAYRGATNEETVAKTISTKTKEEKEQDLKAEIEAAGPNALADRIAKIKRESNFELSDTDSYKKATEELRNEAQKRIDQRSEIQISEARKKDSDITTGLQQKFNTKKLLPLVNDEYRKLMAPMPDVGLTNINKKAEDVLATQIQKLQPTTNNKLARTANTISDQNKALPTPVDVPVAQIRKLVSDTVNNTNDSIEEAKTQPQSQIVAQSAGTQDQLQMLKAIHDCLLNIAENSSSQTNLAERQLKSAALRYPDQQFLVRNALIG